MTFEDTQISECVPPSAGLRRPAFPGTPIPNALHELHMVEAAEAMGIKTADADGHYTGLTHDTILAVMREWHEMKTQRGETAMALDELRAWVLGNLRIKNADVMTDAMLIKHVRGLLDSVKTLVSSITPVVLTTWGNVAHVLDRAGVAMPRYDTGKPEA